MYMISFILILTLFLARNISGYDSRYNTGRCFVLQNKEFAKVLLPKSTGFKRGERRSKTDFNKMTYAGAIFYALNLLVILSIPIFLYLVPEIQVQPLEIDSRYIYIFVDTFNQKLPVIFALILLTAEVIYEITTVILQARKQNAKWLIVLSIILIIFIALFGLLQVEELLSTIIEVF